MIDYFVFDDKDSRDFGVFVGRQGSRPMVHNYVPSKNTFTENINTRHGELVFGQKYNSRRIDITIFLSDSTMDAYMRISRWLGQMGMKPLWLSYEPHKMYYATLENSINPSFYNPKQGTINLSFICYDPFGYSPFSTLDDKSATVYNPDWVYNNGESFYWIGDYSHLNKTSSFDVEVVHLGNIESSPTIRINGAGTNVKVIKYTNSLRNVVAQEYFYNGSFVTELVVDSSLMDTFADGIVNASNVEGEYVTLNGDAEWEVMLKGEDLAFESSITFRLDASSIDDFYKDKIVRIQTLQPDANNEVYYKPITSYDGDSRTAYFEFDARINTRSLYTVYDLKSATNYLRIEADSLNADVLFDFRHTYL